MVLKPKDIENVRTEDMLFILYRKSSKQLHIVKNVHQGIRMALTSLVPPEARVFSTPFLLVMLSNKIWALL
jgi:hypothetical protein